MLSSSFTESHGVSPLLGSKQFGTVCQNFQTQSAFNGLERLAAIRLPICLCVLTYNPLHSPLIIVCFKQIAYRARTLFKSCNGLSFVYLNFGWLKAIKQFFMHSFGSRSKLKFRSEHLQQAFKLETLLEIDPLN